MRLKAIAKQNRTNNKFGGLCVRAAEGLQMTKVYAQQVGPFKYQLVNENCEPCDVYGNRVVRPVEFAGHAEDQAEFPVWQKEKKDDDAD